MKVFSFNFLCAEYLSLKVYDHPEPHKGTLSGPRIT